MVVLTIGSFVPSNAQNIIIQQNNQQQQEKVIVKEKKVPVYVKEESTELTQPVLIHGYLYVYPVDLGNFKVKDFPYDVIRNINRVKAFGRDTWRLPTEEELRVMENESKKLHLHRYGYMCQNAFGRPIPKGNSYVSDNPQSIRLVSTN